MDKFIIQNAQQNKILANYDDKDRILLEGTRKIVNGQKLSEQKVMENEICLYHPYLQRKEQLSFLQILLDERYAEGYLSIPAKVLRKCGYLNERLPSKRIYELLLRVIQEYPITGVPVETDFTEEERKLSDTEDDFETDCYIVGKYSNVLQKNGCFNEVIADLVSRSEQCDRKEQRLDYLEYMLAKRENYTWIEAGTAPILIYFGVTYCYNIMNVMLEQLAVSLECKGVPVLRYDEQKEDIAGLGRYVGRTFRAIIGMQTYLLSVYMKETGRFLHDEIHGPKFNIVLDHPFWLKNQLTHVPGKYYVLTHDEHYKEFVDRYYLEVSGCYLFPPGGILQTRKISLKERKYEVCFIGTYGNYREKCKLILQSERRLRFIANRLLLYLRKEPSLTAEEALKKALDYYDISLSQEQFLEMMYRMGTVIQCVMYYYREKTVWVLADAGIRIDIWGDSWKKSILGMFSNVTIHRDVQWQESLDILRESKISLNVMAWHKGGFTERMANSMLAGAVLLTDETSYHREEFLNGRECVMFSLKTLNTLPEKVKDILLDDTKRNAIARNGYIYAKKNHTWDIRAEEMLSLIDEL